MHHVLFALLNSYSNLAQFLYSYPAIYGEPIDGVGYVVEQTKQVPHDNPLAALKIASMLQAAYVGATCLGWEPSRVVPVEAGLPFAWIWCTIIPYALPQASAASMFGPIDMTQGAARINDPMCQRGFGIDSIEAGPTYAKEIGIDAETLKKTERLVLWYGGSDAASSIGSIQDLWLPSGDTMSSQVVFVTAAGHAQDQNPSLSNDTAALNSTRHYEKQSIKRWLDLE